MSGCAPVVGAGEAPVAVQAGPVAPVLNAANLVGSTPKALDAAFGKPALLRMDGTAQVWLYHSPVCGLNLILFPDIKGVPRVADAVPDNGDAARCMMSLEHGVADAALERPASS
jgi:hypothetical protein